MEFGCVEAGSYFPNLSQVAVYEWDTDEAVFPLKKISHWHGKMAPPFCTCMHCSFVQWLGYAMGIIETSLGSHCCILYPQE